MKSEETVFTVIPARGGSRSIPNKNIRDFAGRPLLYWAVRAAECSDIVKRVIVSTDSANIKDIVEGFNFKKVKVVRRSRESSLSRSPSETALIEAAKRCRFKNLIFLQATNPFIRSADIDRAYRLYKKAGFDSVLSCVPQKRFIWADQGKRAYPLNYDYNNRPMRQDFKGFFVENGALYITSKRALLEQRNRLSGKVGIYPMPQYSYFELDEPDDWKIAETIFLKRKFHLKADLKLKDIRLLVLDVDGVLTDGGVYYSRDGERMVKFNRVDGKGIELFSKKRGKVLVISAEVSLIAKKRLEKLKIENYSFGISDKWKVLKRYLGRNNITLRETAFIGDDIQDLKVIEKVRFSACPSNAVEKVRNRVDYVCERRGGEGAIREAIDLMLMK